MARSHLLGPHFQSVMCSFIGLAGIWTVLVMGYTQAAKAQYKDTDSGPTSSKLSQNFVWLACRTIPSGLSLSIFPPCLCQGKAS